jgi:Tol biopolymer transport system component
MDDLKVELEELKEESDSGRLSTSMSPAVPAPRKKWRAAALIAAVCVLVAGALLLRGRIQPNPRTHAVASVRLTSDAGLTSEPAIWAAGNLIAYASDRAGDNLDIWVQQLQSGEARRLTTNAADDHEPDFSPDGSKIVFRSERDGGGIYLISTLGGTEQKITDRGHNPKIRDTGLLDIATRRFQPIVAVGTGAPSTSWDDRWLTFSSIPLPADPRRQIFITPVHDGSATPRNEWIEATDGSAFDLDSQFSPNGNLLYFQSQRDGSRCL